MSKPFKKPASLNWADITPEYIKWRAEERRENARAKAPQVAEELKVQGFSDAYVEAKTREWLQKTLQSWDDFEREQTEFLSRRR